MTVLRISHYIILQEVAQFLEVNLQSLGIFMPLMWMGTMILTSFLPLLVVVQFPLKVLYGMRMMVLRISLNILLGVIMMISNLFLLLIWMEIMI